jgi:hypothetical protein
MSSFQLAPPACFLEENGCRKGQSEHVSYCVTAGHHSTKSCGAVRCCEDAYHFQRRDNGASSLELYAVFDGHSGGMCARAVADWLPSAVLRMIDTNGIAEMKSTLGASHAALVSQDGAAAADFHRAHCCERWLDASWLPRSPGAQPLGNPPLVLRT